MANSRTRQQDVQAAPKKGRSKHFHQQKDMVRGFFPLFKQINQFGNITSQCKDEAKIGIKFFKVWSNLHSARNCYNLLLLMQDQGCQRKLPLCVPSHLAEVQIDAQDKLSCCSSACLAALAQALTCNAKWCLADLPRTSRDITNCKAKLGVLANSGKVD